MLGLSTQFKVTNNTRTYINLKINTNLEVIFSFYIPLNFFLYLAKIPQWFEQNYLLFVALTHLIPRLNLQLLNVLHKYYYLFAQHSDIFQEYFFLFLGSGILYYINIKYLHFTVCILFIRANKYERDIRRF